MPKFLRDIVFFVASRTDLSNRADILREINYAWGEIWESDDLPNSLFEITVKPEENNVSLLTLPHFVGRVRAIKETSTKIRVELNTPRQWYHDDTYFQSPWTHRILGVHPLRKAITNATRLKFTIPVANPSLFNIAVIGADDRASSVRDLLSMGLNQREVWTTRQFSDPTAIVKSALTDFDVTITGANGEDLGVIPNLRYDARNTVLQITGKCATCCTTCRCWDVLYKIPAPVLHYDEQPIEYPEVLMTKTLEWITLPKDGQERKAVLFGDKSRALLTGFNATDKGVTHKLDIGTDYLYSNTAWGSDKI